MLTIREIFLELNVLEVDGAVRSLEALSKLRDMEHVMHICKVGRELKLIRKVTSLANNSERTNETRRKLAFDAKTLCALLEICPRGNNKLVIIIFLCS